MSELEKAWRRYQALPEGDAREEAWWEYCDIRDGVPIGTSVSKFFNKINTIMVSEPVEVLQ
jgi:hypothetical protein